ncbi:CocE/NonD family hydrolase [Diaminobutyricibacter sp. McL0618]|uniref:CocE/NonD family hydrolase n=1 Tax=Leifsonia sp. McL0618 TaxID=3415677 RepID=UPI003CF59621
MSEAQSIGRITVNVAGGVAAVEVDNPRQLNALTRDMCLELQSVMPALDTDPDVVAITLRGAGQTFSSGATINDLPSVLLDRQADGSVVDQLSRADLAITRVAKPTIALVDGACMGGGWQLASACDFIIASERSVFAITPAKLGVIYPRAGIERLVRQVGPANAKLLLLSGESLSSARALSLGLIADAVPDAEFDIRCTALLDALTTNSRFSMRTLKYLVDLTVADGPDLDREWSAAWAATVDSPDLAIGIDAFLSRTKPSFTWPETTQPPERIGRPMVNEDPVYAPAAPFDEATEPSLFIHFEPGTRVLPAGFQTTEDFQPIPVDIVFEKDTAVTLRDGTTIYVDVLRPAGTDKVPVIVAWSQYGKSGGTHPKNKALFDLLGIDQSRLSGLGKFEGPDPAYWCANGFAICNPDARGAFSSEGDVLATGKQDGQDAADLIEWLAAQEWSNGKVGMAGNSSLAVSQWFTAAEQPEHLAAIAPWEGWSDTYRDLVLRGGMPDLSFADTWTVAFQGKNRREDLAEEARRYPLVGELWQSKVAELEKVTVPAYVVASYSNSIHTPGTFRGWRRIGSTEKWLRIHNTMEWPDFNEPANQDDLRRFFDHYLKGEDNGWETTPRVRYAVLDLEGGDLLNVPATEFPPSDAAETVFFLDGTTHALTTAEPSSAVPVSYDAESEQDSVSFDVTFDKETQIVGYPKARLWVEADGSDDMDVFVLLQKLDANGVTLEQFNVPNHGPAIDNLTRTGSSILKYKGSNGRLRASLRHVDEVRSTESVPAHTFDRVEKLEPGAIVPLDIDLFPVGLAFHRGERLRLTISGFNVLGGVMPARTTVEPDNNGRHVIHAGGSHASYLQLPIRGI